MRRICFRHIVQYLMTPLLLRLCRDFDCLIDETVACFYYCRQHRQCATRSLIDDVHEE